MLLLLGFSFLAGVVTILSPCILPVLPLILSSTVGEGKKKPFGIVVGFILAFTFFTLFLTSIVRFLGVSPNILRNFAVIVILLFGASLLLPKFQQLLEQLFLKLSRFTPKSSEKHGFTGGLLIGASIGLVWTPCVGPILASVISLALTGSVTGTAFLITLAYSIGTGIPMLAILYGGQKLMGKISWISKNTVLIQKVFGIVMILTALGIYFNYDRKFQTYVIEKFPQYGVGLTSFEDNNLVRSELEKLGGEKVDSDDLGKPMNMNLRNEGVAPELIPGGGWINSDPLTLQQLRGKVVLIDFWTYTCINCIRTLPYLRSWHEKYNDKGLVIIGVHTPEFEFEKQLSNVQKAAEDFDLEYAIMQDNDYSTWRAYKNRYWPAKYLIDKNGIIRYHHFGEGDYDETEEAIVELLKETGSDVSEDGISNPTYDVYSRTPEKYLGYQRMQYLIPTQLTELKKDKTSEYLLKEPPLHNFSLGGNWMVGSEYSEAEAGAKLRIQFEAKEVYLVMRSVDGEDGQVRVKVSRDLKTFTDEFGDDVKDGTVTVSENRLYKLVKLDEAGKAYLDLEFINGGVKVFAFTFG